MGWGIVKLKFKKNEVVIKIDYPPHGLQLEKDNWEFLTRTIEGYLLNMNDSLKLKSTRFKNNSLIITYSE